MTIERIAREAGFETVGEARTTSKPTHGEIGGMDVVVSPIMPDGFFAVRTISGTMVFGPKGSYWVPFERWDREQGR